MNTGGEDIEDRDFIGNTDYISDLSELRDKDLDKLNLFGDPFEVSSLQS